jgi:hypothetical protein
MVAAIDKVNWGQFTPYTGLDFDFSSVLCDVLSTDVATRAKSRGFLDVWPFESYGKIGAMPDVISVLLEMLRAYPDYEDKADLFGLMNRLVAQASEYAQFTRWYADEPTAFVAAIRAAFARGSDFYRVSLSDKDSRVRAEAATALGLLRQVDQIPFLLAQLERERDPKVCQAILSSFGELRAESAIPSIARFLGSPDQLTKLQAAGAICRIAQPIPNDAFQVLVVFAMADTPPNRPRSKEQAEAESDLAVKASMLVDKLGEEARYKAAERWIAAMNQLDANHLVAYMHRLLAWTIRQVHERTSPLHFSRLERMVLQALAACSRYWSIGVYRERPPGADTANVLSVPQLREHLFATLYGLPVTQEGLEELLLKLDVP